MGFACGQDPVLNSESLCSLNVGAVEWPLWPTAPGGSFVIKFDEAKITLLSLMSCFFKTEDLETLEEHVMQHGC